jgi:hypothetical protein
VNIDPLATRLSPPFPLEPQPVFWMMDPFTEDLIDDLRQDPRFANLAVAIIDLTLRSRKGNGRGWTTVAGWNLYDERFAASLVKIAALFAAFRLRHNVRAAAGEVDADDGKQLFQAITDDWKPVVQTAVPAGKPDFPHLDRIFTPAGGRAGWSVDFTPTFAKHLRAMIEHSNNHSAAFCIDAIGFQYLNGALAAEGLYSDQFGGLWLGANYAGRHWMLEPISRKTHQGATAKAVAHFLTLLEENRLVDPDSSEEMRVLMRLPGSWFYEGLGKARPPRDNTSDFYAKVGLMGTFHDCAVVERPAEGKTIRYAAVALTAPSAAVLHKLIVKLDDYILAANRS